MLLVKKDGVRIPSTEEQAEALNRLLSDVSKYGYKETIKALQEDVTELRERCVCSDDEDEIKGIKLMLGNIDWALRKYDLGYEVVDTDAKLSTKAKLAARTAKKDIKVASGFVSHILGKAKQEFSEYRDGEVCDVFELESELAETEATLRKLQIKYEKLENEYNKLIDTADETSKQNTDLWEENRKLRNLLKSASKAKTQPSVDAVFSSKLSDKAVSSVDAVFAKAEPKTTKAKSGSFKVKTKAVQNDGLYDL